MWQEQEKLEPPTAVQEDWRLMPTIKYGLQAGGRLTSPPTI